MDLYLAGTGSPWNYVLDGVKNMDLYLAESGGLWGAYFNPNKEENMEIYIAGTEERAKYLSEDLEKYNPFFKTKILQSFYYCNDFTEKVILPSVKKFMLDSGAFTFYTKGKYADWDEWVKRYADFINRNKIDLFFELDIDNLIGYEKVKYYRRKLESMTGKPCIPVWHKSRGKEDFIQMCKDYDYVAIGGITDQITQAEWKYFPYFIDVAHKHGARIHGLGFTSIKNLHKYHFDSVDSTSWTAGNRFGTIYKFNGRTMEQYNRPENHRLADSKATARHNFAEWVKFQKYAETHF